MRRNFLFHLCPFIITLVATLSFKYKFNVINWIFKFWKEKNLGNCKCFFFPFSKGKCKGCPFFVQVFFIELILVWLFYK